MQIVGVACREHVPDSRGRAVVKIRGRAPELDQGWSVKSVAGLVVGPACPHII